MVMARGRLLSYQLEKNEGVLYVFIRLTWGPTTIRGKTNPCDMCETSSLPAEISASSFAYAVRFISCTFLFILVFFCYIILFGRICVVHMVGDGAKQSR